MDSGLKQRPPLPGPLLQRRRGRTQRPADSGAQNTFEGSHARVWRLALLLFLFRGFFFEGGLGGGEAGDGHAEGGATDVAQADAVAEFDRVGIATVFTADAKFDVWTSAAAFLDGNLHQVSDAGLVDGGEGILLDDFQ